MGLHKVQYLTKLNHSCRRVFQVLHQILNLLTQSETPMDFHYMLLSWSLDALHAALREPTETMQIHSTNSQEYGTTFYVRYHTFQMLTLRNVFIAMISMEPYKCNIPTSFKRTQLPLRFYFAVSIHKSEGQTLSIVERPLGEHYFSQWVRFYFE